MNNHIKNKYLIPKEELTSEDEKYLTGKHNKAIRIYFYLERGLEILNAFRNLFLGILAIYIALKLTNVLWMIAMFIPCIIILVGVGWYNVHKLSKLKEWLGMRFSTHYGIRSFNYQQRQCELLEEIKEKLNQQTNVPTQLHNKD